MKNLLKVFFAAFLLVAVNSGAFAQNSDSDDATVSASVVTSLSVTKNADVSFGGLTANSTAILSATGASNSNVGVNASLGKFTVEGSAGTAVTLSYENVILTDGDEGELTFEPSLSKSNSSVATYGSAITNNTYSINSSTGDNLTEGTDYIFVGGSIEVPNNATTGEYSGTFTLTATYN